MEEKYVKRAAAIRYDPESDGAPVLTAFGEGHMAERIVASAEASGVPVVPDAGLASVLARMSVGDEVPAELYEVVAKLLVFVGEMDHSYGERVRAAAQQ
ncbi:MAG: EscU/YscU/HrcU family type III secretion system export apparatus switch protein [Oscillospiraceae bacterium]|jgi:flagellar biosynthesis protein|nr:EscU/YscU/HrcU family type III secretion system export apparatus switch protein [Oscillospiraceae bacterium]